MKNNVISFHLEDEDGNEIEHCLPAKNDVCPRCGGYGKHTNPNIDGNGITESEWSEWDIEEKESYLNGVYDVICTVCNGNNVVLVTDEAAMNAEQKELYELWLMKQRERAEYDRICYDEMKAERFY